MPTITIDPIADDATATAQLWNARFAQITSLLNGNLDAANLADGAVTTAKLATDAVTGAKIGGLRVYYDSNTTQTTNNSERIVKGWGYIQGNGTRSITKSVSLPFTFAAAPIVIANCSGYKATSAPTSLTDVSGTAGEYIQAVTPTTTAFTVILIQPDAAATSSTNFWLFSFIVIGTPA